MQLTLKAIRINIGWSQEEAAKNIGISQETLANYEKGKTFPDVPTIIKIEKAYNTEYKNIKFLCQENTV